MVSIYKLLLLFKNYVIEIVLLIIDKDHLFIRITGFVFNIFKMGKFPTRNEFSITNNVTKCSMLINFDKIYNFLTSILDKIRKPDKEGAHVLLAKAIGIPAS